MVRNNAGLRRAAVRVGECHASNPGFSLTILAPKAKAFGSLRHWPWLVAADVPTAPRLGSSLRRQIGK